MPLEWLEGFIQRAVEQAPSPLHEAGPEIYDFFAGFHELCQLLSVSPVYTDVPGHRGRPVQAVSDAQGELANNIKGLPKYHAYVRLRTQDGVQVSHVKLAPPPLTFEEEQQRKSKERQPERAARINRKIKGVEDFDLENLGGWAPDTGFYFTTKEFQESMAGLMADLQKSQTPEARMQKARVRSRERFGTPREQVEADIKLRQQRLVHGQPVKPEPETPASPPIDLARATAQAKRQREHGQGKDEPKRPGEEYHQPPLGRRSPKKKRGD
ncbi:hypothetical protein J7F03_30225 [Streptomyces sp. ISL-43]|uniref:hypothetical protein n=1 Tax=Streptomyces sp. ISL-43 TaxID=2819183 RepID=UPI001BE5CAB8|nr:hypothetical protein [Streptomyces sp. ISL-43]MBT2451271.1 hypothetical protein [Streptomyces sp. ISL-43]